MEIHENVSHNTIFSLYFSIFSYDFIVYAYFPYAATSSTKIDDVTYEVYLQQMQNIKRKGKQEQHNTLSKHT